MEWSPIFDFIISLLPWFQYVFIALGGLTVVGTAVDTMIPDEKDKGFMKKILAIPVLGSLLSAVIKFSPFNFKK